MNKGYASIFFVTFSVFSLLHLPAIPFSSTPHTVYLSSPPNGSFTNMDCGSLQFIYNHTGSLSGVVNCLLYMDDQAVNYTTNVSENTPISVYSNTSWNESQHSWYVDCTNGTAQESSIDFYNGSCWIFTADFTPPSVTINEPANTTYNTTNITLNTTITDDNLDTCWYSLDNWATNIPYSCSLTTINASEGPNTVRVGVNDSAGNVNDVEYASFMVSLGELIVEKTALTPVVNNNGVVNVTCGYKGGTPTYPLMRPDKETLSKWIESYNAAPLTSIKKADKVRGFQVPSPSPGGSYDLFDYLNYTPTERDQGSCGNCWAWAGTGCLEVALDVQESTKDRLSVQYINSCESEIINKTCCAGGWLYQFAEFYNITGKAVPWSNTNADWQDGNASCNTNCSNISTIPHYPISYIDELTIPTQTVNQTTAVANIKDVIDHDKAVWFAFYLPTGADWDVFFDFWDNDTESVIWNPDYSCGHTNDSELGGHVVLCMGYNDTDVNNSYWVMLNSWGTDAGSRPNGTFRLDMNMNYSCYFYYPSPPGNVSSFYWQTLNVSFGGGASYNLSVEKYALTPVVNVSGIAQFVINVTNIGTVNATSIYVIDEYNTTYFNFSASNPVNNSINYTGGEVEWIVNISVNETITIHLNLTTLQQGIGDNTVFAENESGFEYASDNVTVNITGEQPNICYCEDCSTCQSDLNNATCDEVRLNNSIPNQAGACINNPGNFSDKTFDCQGHTINGSGYDNGIYLNGKYNNTIKNCVISNFDNGVQLNYSDNNDFIDFAVTSNLVSGFAMYESDHNYFHNVTVTSNQDHGFFLKHSDHNIFIDFSVTSNLVGGFAIKCDNNSIINSTIDCNGSGVGVNVSGNASNLTILNSNITNCAYGILFGENTSGCTVNNTRICGNTLDIRDYNSNSGSNNTCNTTNNWNDNGYVNCSWLCNGSQGQIQEQPASISVNKHDITSPPYNISSTIQFIINITNNGDSDIQNISVNDTSLGMGGFYYNNESNPLHDWFFSGECVGWSVANISSNSSYVIYVNFTASQQGNWTNTVVISNDTGWIMNASANISVLGGGGGEGEPENYIVNGTNTEINSTNKSIFLNFTDLPGGNHNVTVNQIPTPGNEQWIINSTLTNGTFNVTITFNYNETLLHPGSFEKMLFMQYYNSSSWVPINSSVNTINNIITAQLDHFTNFSLSSNMTVNGTDITDDMTSRGSKGAPILMLNFTNNGASDNITQMIITSKNTNNSDVAGVMLCGDDGDGEFNGEIDCASPINETTFSSNETGANATFPNLSVNIPANNNTIIYVVYANISSSAVIGNILDALIPVNGITLANSGNNTGEINPEGNTTITAGLLNNDVDLAAYDGVIAIPPDASNNSAGEIYTNDSDENPPSVFQAMMNSSINAIQLFVNHTSSGNETYLIDADDNNETGWSFEPGSLGIDLEIITDGSSGNVTVRCFFNATTNFTLSPENTYNCYNVVNVTYNNTGAQGEIILNYDHPQSAHVSKYDHSWVYLHVPEAPRIIFVNLYTIQAQNKPNASLNFGTAREVYTESTVEINNPSESNKNITNTSILLDTNKPLLEFAEKEHSNAIVSIENIRISNDTTKLNWTLNTTEPDECADIYAKLFDRSDLDYGYNASVNVDTYDFNGSGAQTLTVVVDVYNKSNADDLHVHISKYGWNNAPSFLNANITGITSTGFDDCSISGDGNADCDVEGPATGSYTATINISVNASSPSMYRPMVEIGASKRIAGYNVNSNTVTNTTFTGNFTITSDNMQWTVRRVTRYVSQFHAILTNGTNVINGTVNYTYPTNTIKPLTRIEIKDLNTQLWTDENGYYEIYVPNGIYDVSAGRDRPDAMQQSIEGIVNATQNATLNFTLQNGSVITGSVFDAGTNESMNETCVRVKNESWSSEEGTCNLGYYRIHVPACGNYTLKLCNYDTDDFSISDIGQGNLTLHNLLASPPRPRLFFSDYYDLRTSNEPNATVSFGAAREVYTGSSINIENPTDSEGNITNLSVKLNTNKTLRGFREEGDGVTSLSNNHISNDITELNWTLEDITPDKSIGLEAGLFNRAEIDYGYNTNITVDKFSFNGEDTQKLIITVDVYNNSDIDTLSVSVNRGYEPGTIDYIDVNVTNATGPGYMDQGSDHVHWNIENPETETYIFSANLTINATGQVKYRPHIEITAGKDGLEYKADSNVVENSTFAGNFTVTSNNSKWRVYWNTHYNTKFNSIVTNTTGLINGTINYAFTPTTNSSPITSISLCNDSIGCYDVYTNDSGYYIAYVPSGTYNVCAGSDRPDAMLKCNNSVPSNSTCDFTLQNGSVIAGSVFNATSNKSIAHIGLRLWNSSYEWGSDTNDYGYYSMHVPASGNYTLSLGDYDTDDLFISNAGQGKLTLHNFLASPLRPEIYIYDTYSLYASNEPDTSLDFGMAREAHMSSNVNIRNPSSAEGNITNTSVQLDTSYPLRGFREEGDGVISLHNDYVSNDTISINWTIEDIAPDYSIGVGADRLERNNIDYGYNASVNVDTYDFNGSGAQTLTVVVDVYNSSNFDSLEVNVYRGYDENKYDYVNTSITGFSKDENWDNNSDGVWWNINNPCNTSYIFTVNLSINTSCPTKYRPDVEIGANKKEPMYKFDGNIIELNSTFAGNFTINSNDSKWRVYEITKYRLRFKTIVTNASGTINGTISYNYTPTGNLPTTQVSIHNKTIGYDDKVYTTGSGYYIFYVPAGSYDIRAGSDRPDAMPNGNNSILANSTCDLTLQNGGVIAGFVFNATTNESMNNTKVMLWNLSWQWTEGTNNHGYYRMHIPVSGNYTLGLKNYLSNQLDISNIGQGNCSVHNLLASEDTGAPVIYLLSPNGTTYDATNNVTFNYNVADDLRIANCSLWTNVSGNWSRDVTEWDIKNNKNNSFTKDNISNGHYLWNIECTDDSPNHNTNFSQNGNFTFTVKYITCGDNITEDTVLTQDLLNCSSGLNIGADNIMLDCNGHTVSGTLPGQQFHGIFAEGRDNITIKNCIISNYLNSSAIYLNQTHNSRLDNNTVLDSGSGIALENSTNNNVTNNRVNDTNWAISLWQSSHLNRIINNTLACGGVFLNSGDNNTLSNNTIHNNNGTGIYLEDCFDNVISNNTVYNNIDEGIYLKSSDGNLIYNNYLNNTFNAYDNGTNYWNTTYQNGTGSVIDGAIGGNFFSDYTGWDNTGDRIGNTANYTVSGGGNVDCLPLTLNSDTIPPNVSSLTPTSGDEDTQINFTANVSDDVNVTSCNLYIGGVDNGSMNLSDGVASRLVTFATPGDYNLTANCSDAAGNYNDTSVTAVTINDITSPSVSAIQPASGDEDTLINFNATVLDNVGVLACSLYINGVDNGSMDISGNVTNKTVTFTVPGNYNLTANCSDAAGNYNDTSTTAVAIGDTTRPSVSTIMPTSGDEDTAINFTANVSDNAGVTACHLYINGVDNGSMNVSGNVANRTVTFTAPGNYNLTANCSDAAGNYNDTSTTAVAIGDTTRPSVSTIMPTSGDEDTAINFTANVSDNVGVTSCSLYINGVDNGSMNVSGNVANRTVTFIAPGNYNLTANCSDATGNYNDTSVTAVTVNDVTPPSVTLNAPADNYTDNSSDPVDVTFNCSANDSNCLKNLTLFVWNASGTVYNTSTSNVGGTSNSSSWIVSLVNGNYSWNCLAYDSGGLTAWGSNNRSIAVNYSGPIILDTAIIPYAVINGSNLTLQISAINSQSLWASIVKPGASKENLTLTNNANTTFTNTTLTGRYNVTFYVNDTHGTMVNTTDYFESFQPLIFNLTVVDYNNTGVNSTWTIYYRNETVSGNNSENGSYSHRIPDTLFDTEIKAYVNRLRLLIKKINVSSENNKVLGMDKKAMPVSGFLVTYAINNNYSFTNATLILYYDNLNGSYTNESNLHLYKCGVWNFTSQTCTGNWTDITNDTTQNTNSHLFSYVTTSFSGFSINESSTTTTTTTTTTITVTTTVSGNGGNGGGGGGGGGFSAIAVTKATCFDGLTNCHDGSCEEGVDCGGPCKPCPSCSDRIQNQGEEGIDCGGPCDPCEIEAVTTTTTQIIEATSTIITNTSTTSTTIKTNVTLPPTPTTIPDKDTSIRDSGIVILGLLTLLVIFLHFTKKEKRRKKKIRKKREASNLKNILEQKEVKAREEKERKKEIRKKRETFFSFDDFDQKKARFMNEKKRKKKIREKREESKLKNIIEQKEDKPKRVPPLIRKKRQKKK